MTLTISNNPSPFQTINESQSVTPQNFSKSNFHGRDIVIINPVSEGGGDRAMANKIANIALGENCRVSICSVDIKNPDNLLFNHLSLRDNHTCNISEFNKPIFIVAPIVIFRKSQLKGLLQKICETHQFPKQDIILIEEMDLPPLSQKKIPLFEKALKEIGFQNISTNRLGFSEGAIGYLPTDEQTITAVRQRFEGELAKIIDSYNMSLTKESRYHLAYISSQSWISGTQVYIANSLTETMDDPRDINFIMVLRELESNHSLALAEKLDGLLMEKNDQFDFPSLFAKARLFFINSNSGVIENQLTLTGAGKRNLNIVITNNLPKNIFEDFMCLAHSGMASGDQSFSEYLSLKGEMPYYDMQPWKVSMVQAVKNLAGDELKDYIAQKIVGKIPYTGETVYQLAPNVNQQKPSLQQLAKREELNKKLSSHTATEYIKNLITTTGKN